MSYKVLKLRHKDNNSGQGIFSNYKQEAETLLMMSSDLEKEFPIIMVNGLGPGISFHNVEKVYDYSKMIHRPAHIPYKADEYYKSIPTRMVSGSFYTQASTEFIYFLLKKLGVDVTRYNLIEYWEEED